MSTKYHINKEKVSKDTLVAFVVCSFDEDQLVTDLFNGYNSLIRPVPNASSPPIEVAFSLALVLLINVDEKNQIMHTNVWPTMQCDEWKFVSMVLDRLLLYIFFAATLGGTIGVLFSAPNVFEYVDQAAVIEKLKQAAAAEQNTSN
ncbi:hypothetical protein TELCIR_16717 [Teladorsagia circumcincta]|uniref:Neurotransmitter-gated ion-channel ligand-binding domain-containing protein n=1 Tax=Teladorsagia circumcincta TaxID=45464 RepID=A0A2G9TWW7_TELCI|nr:hypothetical protein TELCIR_16717 [Teladorsagia circumcincta]